MKKFALIAILVFLPSLSPAAGRLIVGGGWTTNAGGGGGGGGGDTCTGDLLFSWHMQSIDVTLGSLPGCSVGDTTATLQSSATLSTAQYKEGEYSLALPTASDNALFSVVSEDIIKHTAGTIDTWVYVSSFGNSATFLRAQVDTNNYIRLVMTTATDNHFKLMHIAGGTGRLALDTISGGFLTNTWYHIIAKWDYSAHSGSYMSLCADTTNGTTNCGTSASALGTWAGTLTGMEIGEAASAVQSSYIGSIKIYGAWQ